MTEPLLLAVDVGNTSVAVGVFEGERLVHSLRLTASRRRTSDEYAVLLPKMLASRGVAVGTIAGAVIASVVPELTEILVRAIRRGFARDPLVVGAGTRTGMPLRVETPREVGADRIVNALAAFERVRGAVIVVDLGTATVFDCVSGAGEYVGGAIAPGVRLAADALSSSTALLSKVDLVAPAHVVGTSTSSAMRSGIVLGWACLVDGLLARLVAELGAPCRVLATGGLAAVVAPHARRIDEVVPSLTLDGLRLVWARSRSLLARGQQAVTAQVRSHVRPFDAGAPCDLAHVAARLADERTEVRALEPRERRLLRVAEDAGRSRLCAGGRRARRLAHAERAELCADVERPAVG